MPELVPGSDGPELDAVAGLHVAIPAARGALPSPRVRGDMMDDFAGRVALVTGPARGIGEALARGLAARGARLALVGMEPERLEALAGELGPTQGWLPCEGTDQAPLERGVAVTG